MHASWRLMNHIERAFGRDSTERSRRSHRGKGIEFNDSLKSCAQIYSYASSNENSRCKSRSAQGMEKARDDPSMEFGKSQEQKGGHSGSSKRQKESPLCPIDGHLTPQKMRRWSPNYRSTKAESCSGDIVKDDSGAYAVFPEQVSERLRPR